MFAIPTRLVSAAALFAIPALLPAQGSPLAPYGVGVTVPAPLQGPGLRSSSTPLGSGPARYQQLIPASDLPDEFEFHTLGFRKDEVLGVYPGHTVELEILVGYTTMDKNSMSEVFLLNWDAGTPDTVLARQNVALPDLPWARPATPEDFGVQIGLDEPFHFSSGLGHNLLIEIRNWGNDQGGAPFSYPLNAGIGHDGAVVQSTVTSRVGPVSGLALRGFGLALRLLADADQAAGYAPVFNPFAAGGPNPPSLMGGAPPLLGSAASLELLAPGFDLGLLTVATDVSNGLIIPVVGAALPVHTAPGATLGTVSLPILAGQGFTEIFIPNNIELLGMDAVCQAFCGSSTNPLAIGATNALMMNLGIATAGIMQFAITHTRGIDPNSYLGGTTPEWVHCSGSSADKVHLTGSKSQTIGPLEIYVLDTKTPSTHGAPSNPARSIPAGSSSFSETIDVPAGHYIFLYNAGHLTQNVTWEVDVVS